MNSNSNNFREMFWDESNRLRVVYDQNSYQMQHYIYDATGERILKASSQIETVYENGQVEANTTTMGLYTTYVSPYMVVDANQKYSKHYFNGTQRVASKIGEQDIAIFENGNQYLKQESSKTTDTPSIDFEALKTKQITDFSYYVSKSKNTTTAKNLKINYTEYKKADANTETTSAKAADNNSAFAAPQYAEIYYYHSDHLGTGTFLSDFDGNPYQFFLNLPFGETMAEQHSYSGEYTNRYKFNGKELDEETGFYYYGARYYNPKFSIWLSVDPLAEKYPNFNTYAYCYQNPVNVIDPTGMEGESIHLDKYGNVLKNIDDGDNGVYVHKDAKSKADIDKNYSSKNTDANGKKIGEIGGTIDANTIYSNALTKNMNEAEDLWSPFKFRDYVKNGGKWDLKNNDNTIYGLANDGKTKFSFEGKLMESQDIGNHHFGAVGKAYGLFTEEFMLKQAGEAQIKAGTSKPEWQKYINVRVPVMTGDRVIWKTEKQMIAPYGDDPRDQSWIKSGFNYFKRKNK